MCRTTVAALLVVALAPTASAHAADEERLAATIGDVLGYCRTLDDPSSARILLLDHGGLDRQSLATALASHDLSATVVTPAELATALPNAEVVLLGTGSPPEASEAAALAGALTLSDDEALVQQGLASVGLLSADGRFQVLVHAARLEREGHRLGANLLQVARFVVPASSEAGIVPPLLLDFDLPDYPPKARRAQLEGDVVIRALVGLDGRVRRTELTRGLDDGTLDEAALDAVRSAVFQPAEKNGEPIEVWHIITIPFRLH